MRLRRSSLLLVVGLVAPALATATYWSPPLNVHPQNDYSEWTASLAIANDGVPWVVWGVEPLYSRWNGSAWEPAKPVYPTGDGLFHRWPKLACGLDGSLWVLWEADLRYSWFFGMASRWDGSGWSRPDTLWISNTPSATTYDLAPVSQNEAWFIRSTHYSKQQVEAIHLAGDQVTSYQLGDPNLGNGTPSIAVDREGIVWATWLQSSLDPSNLRRTIAYSRFVNGVWESPGSASGPVLMNRYGLVAAVDGTKWIVSHEQDPRFGLLLNTYARRWMSPDWSAPQLISDPISSGDTIQAQLSVNRNCNGYPTATWLRGGASGPSRLDVLVSRWDGSHWTRPIMAGRHADSSYANWPAAAATDTSMWVAYQKAIPPNWVSNIFTTHTIPYQSLEGLASFSADRVPSGAKLSWSIPEATAPAEVRIHRFSGTVTLSQGTPPPGSVVIAEFSKSRAKKGVTVDQLRMPGTFAYWLEVLEADGSAGWLGPRLIDTPETQTTSLTAPVVLRSRIVPGQGVEFLATVQSKSGVRVSIYDVQGRRIRVLPIRYDNSSPDIRVAWDGRAEAGQRLASGVYFARLEGSQHGDVGVSKVVWAR